MRVNQFAEYILIVGMACGAIACGGAWSAPTTIEELNIIMKTSDATQRWQPLPVTLAPAAWVWLPSQRTLPNTFVLFRKDVNLVEAPKSALGWISADSRYRLTVNGRRVQWGTAPCDPRNVDADPVDIARYLHAGKNVIGVEVMFYGHGDGTWPAGKPGFIFNAAFEYANGQKETVVSDASWLVYLDRAHRPGQYKRWFLRSLQEEFDARLHPFGWDTPEYTPDAQWVPAMGIECPPDKPPACSRYEGNDLMERARDGSLRARQIPMLKEIEIPVMRLADCGRVTWKRDPNDWFEFRIPDSFDIVREPVVKEQGANAWTIPATASREGVFATFEFKEQIVGWPYFTIDAPEGTIVELMIQESHDPNGPLWMDTHFHSWSRFICREGENRFEPFDYESFRWVQLHVRNASRPVVIRDVGVRRRIFDWPQRPHIECAEPALQTLFNATMNTIYNSALETFVDGMGRERQQYSGDCGPQLFVSRYALGENRLPARYLRTYSEGMTPQGYFMDCWPAFDRLARVMQKQMGGAYWGPILDHGIGFNFDCWWHYLDTGNLDDLREPYPRLLRFEEYLESIVGEDGLLPVENLGIPTVWIDHDAYKQQKHKQCAFNLYASAMLEHALAPICRAFGDDDRAAHMEAFGKALLKSAQKKYWDKKEKVFVVNRPWLDKENGPRYCDRSLATAILYDQCPKGSTDAALKKLVECPPEMGLSYPANAYWRFWALSKLGRTDVIVNDFRSRWATMPSVTLNNALQETWKVRVDATDEWSHCPLAPVYVLLMDIAGIRPSEPGFAKCTIRPQLADLPRLALTMHTVRGPIQFTAEPENGGHRVSITVPAACEAELLLPAAAQPGLESLSPGHPLGLKRYRLFPGAPNTFILPKP